MHDFHYRGEEVYCENLRVRDVVERVGTPFYLYSHKTLLDHYRKFEKAFRSIRPLICFSMKANGNVALLKALIDEGAGVDIVSGGELFRALRAGCAPKKIVYAGVGKTEEEIREAIRVGILLFNVESIPELETIDRIARGRGKVVNISLRVNPAIDPRTHVHIATGEGASKFGIDLRTAHQAFVDRGDFPNLTICGLHVHIGSQIVSGGPFVQAFRKVLDLVDRVEQAGVKIEYLNLGGGLGIIYRGEKPQTAQEFAGRVLPLLRGRKFRVIFEPGRFIVGNAGVFVTKVLYVKKTGSKNFVVVDGAMNDLIRPALYSAYHEVWPLVQSEAKRVRSDVVGPICESGDFLAKDRMLPELSSGDLLVLLGAGAYGFAMSSNYNSRPRVPEVLAKGREFAIIRERETYEDLTRLERIPSFLR